MDQYFQIYKECISFFDHDYRYHVRVSYLYDEDIMVLSDEEEGYKDLRERLTPYFEIVNEKVDCEYKVFQKHVSADSMIWKQFEGVFMNCEEEIIAHRGNSKDQLRIYNKVQTPYFQGFMSKDKLSVIMAIGKRILVIATEKKRLSLESRRVVKDVLASRLVERNNGIIFHCAVVEKDGTCMAFMGNKGDGKTGRLIRQLFDKAHFVTSDRGYYTPQNGWIYGWPEPLNITNDMVKLFGINMKQKNYIMKDNDKVAVKYVDIPEVFSTEIVKGGELKYIIFPKIELAQPTKCKKLGEIEFLEKIKNNCLSPEDNEHPHWIELVKLPEKYEYNKEKSLFEICNNCIGIELTVGNDEENELKCMKSIL